MQHCSCLLPPGLARESVVPSGFRVGTPGLSSDAISLGRHWEAAGHREVLGGDKRVGTGTQ